MNPLTRSLKLALMCACAFAAAAPATADSAKQLLYTLSNDIAHGKNAVVAYIRNGDGSLTPHPSGPFATRGTGIDNDTNGKLGPNDNDTPLIVSVDRKRLFAVNGGSNTIAVFDILDGGALRHVPGSPFPSRGVGPVSLAMTDEVLLVANRNEDPRQLEALQGKESSSYAAFRIGTNGALSFVSAIDVADGQKATQILVSQVDKSIAFGNDFQVDVDFDGEGSVSKLFGLEAKVQGQLHSFRLGCEADLSESDKQSLPETVEPAPDVPTIPLGIWDHPTRRLLYVGLVTRNQLGVFRYDEQGKLAFVSAVDNSGQDICWLKTNKSGTRLYAVNNLPREDRKDTGSTVTVFDIAGKRAEKPLEIGRVVLPLPSGTFVNNRAAKQPNSAAFQFDIDGSEKYLYVICQRIDQSRANKSMEGNILHTVLLSGNGTMKVVASRRMAQDGVTARSRPQGVVCIDL